MPYDFFGLHPTTLQHEDVNNFAGSAHSKSLVANVSDGIEVVAWTVGSENIFMPLPSVSDGGLCCPVFHPAGCPSVARLSTVRALTLMSHDAISHYVMEGFATNICHVRGNC